MLNHRKNARVLATRASSFIYQALTKAAKTALINPPDRRVDQATLRPDFSRASF